jgi:cold-inducible RNA-binding protein
VLPRARGRNRWQEWKLALGEVNELSKKIYVGNLSYGVTEVQVREMFEEHGTVDSIAWITDRDTGRFRGFCFVEMEESAANAAIKSINGQLIDGRELNVNEARPKNDNKSRSGSGGGGGNKSYNDRW